MKLTCVKGERIVLTDSCYQTFYGVVKSVNPDTGRLMLTDVIKLPEMKPINGYRHFDSVEILEIGRFKPFDSDNVMKDKKTKESEQSADSDQAAQQQPNRCSEKLSKSQLAAIKKLQDEHRLIRDFGTNFHAAISMLKASTIIGVAGQDVSNGRFGRASVLAISCPTQIFVFDLQGLGDEAFHRGLKEILESPDIVKVAHDCRLLSDCLKHKHLVNLENVMDVEAEDIMVVFQERRVVRRHSRSLQYLFKVYLGVEVEEVDEGDHTWMERPLHYSLLNGLVSSVSFLIPLQKVIECKYLNSLKDASKIYNNHVRDLDLFDIFNEAPEKTLRDDIIKLLVPQTNVRSDYRAKKTA